MVFSSIPFLYYFLPITLLLYFITKPKYRNKILLLCSLFFYYYGDKKYILLLIFSCIFNYYIGKHVAGKKKVLILALLVDFGLLFFFKYTNFFLENINKIGNTNFSFIQLSLPIGISFFTFQSSSYIIDIYKGNIKPAKNLLDFTTYLTLFPQLIAGPIVRYEEIDKEMQNRKFSWKNTEKGLTRFIIGLAKKVIIANTIGELIIALKSMEIQTVLSTWIQGISYTLQLYFDFSAYSDMAIGLGLVFGFTFKENFNYPLIAKNITDFWKRWHISLSSWFKDYLYIPLGGNKKGKKKTIRNILIVWITTGFWHGADWNFLLWGLYFAIFLLIEKFILKDFLKKHSIASRIYTLIIVMISFVIFSLRTQDISTFLQNMIGRNNLTFTNLETTFYLKNYTIILLSAMIGATPYIKKSYLKAKEKWKIINGLEPILITLLLIITTAFIIDESYNPFLYFRF